MLIHGDCLEVLPTMDRASADSIVTDPPYGIGFMGKDWDHGVPGIKFWSAMLPVAKPGAHLLAFGGTRTFHRLMCSIEDAGWEIRDTIMWVYGSGFPKSHNGPWGGTALKPSWEPIIVARKPLEGTLAENYAKHRTGALNIDGCRVDGPKAGGSGAPPLQFGGANHRPFHDAAQPRKFDTTQGRWPANLIHDGSNEVVDGFPHTESGKPSGMKAGGQKNAFGVFAGGVPVTGFGDAGSASRFFYCAKASQEDRGRRNTHPTVKPTALMRYLCRLVTPEGGLVLDPFAGSGSTGKAAVMEGFRFAGIEKEAEYLAIARGRIDEATPLGSTA